MKPVSVILNALWQAWFRPVSYLQNVPFWGLSLLLLGRSAFAIVMGLPMTLIMAMVSDSGTRLAEHGAFVMMYAMLLLAVCAPLLWSWRCASAGALITACSMAIMLFCGSLDEESRNNKNPSAATQRKIDFVIALSVVMTIVITEALPAPIRNTYHFVKWCIQDEDALVDADTNILERLEMSKTEVV